MLASDQRPYGMQVPMKFMVVGDPQRFHEWIARFNGRNTRTISLGDPPREYRVASEGSTKIGLHRHGEAHVYEIIQPPDEPFPAELLGEIARAFPDLEFIATHGEFEIKNQKLVWQPAAATEVAADRGDGDPDPDLPVAPS